MEIIQVSEIPASYTLIQNGSEVAEILEYLGTDAVADGYTYVFVEVGEGEYTGAYGTYTLSTDGSAYPIL